jgi:sulfate transport system ATP-binding protein
MEVASEIVVMNQGRVEQVGTPAEIYDQPASSFVMSFIGPVNVLPGNAGLFSKGGTVVEGDCATDSWSLPTHGDSRKIFLRPHDIGIHTYELPGSVVAVVERVIHLGWEIQVELLLASEQRVTAYLSRDDFARLQLVRNQQVYVKPKQIKVFAEHAVHSR